MKPHARINMDQVLIVLTLVSRVLCLRKFLPRA
jgi:hypothetical protein